MTHLLHFGIINSHRMLRNEEQHFAVCTTPLRVREMVRERKRRESSIAGVKKTDL